MKKTFNIFVLLFAFLFLISANYALAAGFVPCGGGGTEKSCEFTDFFVMIGRIYSFFLIEIVIPIAVLMITIGGLMYLLAGAKPEMANRGKQILIITMIGIVLMFGAYAIVTFILGSLGISQQTLPINPFGG